VKINMAKESKIIAFDDWDVHKLKEINVLLNNAKTVKKNPAVFEKMIQADLKRRYMENRFKSKYIIRKPVGVFKPSR